MQKCHDITIIGKVQDIGFRSVVEYAGRLLGLPGVVFNAKDGSIKIICCGEDTVISEFFHEIKTRGEQRGAIIEDIEEQVIPFKLDLPDKFTRVLTDEDIDIGRKLDKGNDLLIDIKSDTSAIKSDTSSLPEIKNIIGSFVVEQREHNQGMKEHNQHLEKILEKLAER